MIYEYKSKKQNKMVNYQNGKIYQIVNDVNSKVYIGSTCQTLCRRMSIHRAEGKLLRYKTPIYLAMHEIGVEHFRILLVQNAPCNSKEELLAIEYDVAQRYQQRGVILYNSIIDGQHSEETRAKMSTAHMGKVISAETRAKISKIHTGKVISAETRAKISKAQMGRGSVRQEGYSCGNSWRFYWREDGKQKRKPFSVKKYGYDGAHGLALFYQEEMYPVEREDDSEFIDELKAKLKKLADGV